MKRPATYIRLANGEYGVRISGPDAEYGPS
jgi:hypothetical protein